MPEPPLAHARTGLSNRPSCAATSNSSAPTHYPRFHRFGSLPILPPTTLPVRPQPSPPTAASQIAIGGPQLALCLPPPLRPSPPIPPPAALPVPHSRLLDQIINGSTLGANREPRIRRGLQRPSSARFPICCQRHTAPPGSCSCLPSAPPAAHCPSSNPPPLHSRGSRLGAFNCGCKRVPPVVFICPTRAISSVAGGSSFGASSFGGYSFLVYTTAAPWSSARKSTELNPPFLR